MVCCTLQSSIGQLPQGLHTAQNTVTRREMEPKLTARRMLSLICYENDNAFAMPPSAPWTGYQTLAQRNKMPSPTASDWKHLLLHRLGTPVIGVVRELIIVRVEHHRLRTPCSVPFFDFFLLLSAAGCTRMSLSSHPISRSMYSSTWPPSTSSSSSSRS